MLINGLILCLIGLSAGFTIAGGIFALITTVSIIPRLADKTHTASYVTSYETSVILGGILGNLITIYSVSFRFPTWTMAFYGIFTGIFVGCLATALAEALNVTAVFTRRLKLHTGIRWVILSMAIAKILGSLFYFYGHYDKQ